MTRFSLLAAPVAALCMTAGLAAPAAAQYFGQNKVQHKKLDFQILKTENFDIYFYPSEREGIDHAARMAERWHARLERLFDYQLSGRQPLILYAAHPDFEQTNVLDGAISESTGGVTESLRRRIVLPLAGPLRDTDHVIGHELVHAFQYDIMIGPNAPPTGVRGLQLPLWFIEGMAEYFSIGPVDPHTAMWLRDAARQERLPNVKDLDDPRYFPYRWGHALWAYVGGRYGDDVIQRVFKTAVLAGDLETAFREVLGVTEEELSTGWHASIRETYGPVLEATVAPARVGEPAVRPAALGGELNVGPSLSPDGRWVAFYSERGLLSIDLFLADTSTGEVVRRLTQTATDPHYSSIQFIQSAGAWDRSSRRIAVAAVRSGRPALAIFDALSGNRLQEIRLPELDEVFNPAWAPDGNAIAFTGMDRGLTDLFVYDLQTSQLRRLTNDAYADLMPAWSPDGRRIAFSTDRFTSSLDTLTIGAYRLALVDPATSAVEEVQAFSDGKHINPQWTPDSASLYFLSDRDGVPNLYRVNLASGDLAQITRVSTGLSGITSTSPALSVAAETGTISFTVYQDGKYQIHTLAAGTEGTAPVPYDPRAADLPPGVRAESAVAAAVGDASLGLPPTGETFETEEYKSSLSLEAVGAPSISVGADRFGAAVGGGIGFQFGDMLGEQRLAVGLQLNAGLSGNYSALNTAAQALYYNSASRWNWGIAGGQVPYLSGGTRTGRGVLFGEPVQVDETIIQRQTQRSVAGLLAYPFSRAQRVEWQAGVSRISFDEITQTTVFSLRTGQRLSDDRQTTPLGDPVNLVTTSMALVYDTSSFGATSPVQGQRYRFEVAPNFGTINYTNVLTDYRKYYMPVSFYTVAARALHYGRYGSGSEDLRLTPLFLGYPNLIRGWDFSTITTDEDFNRVIGSRMLVGNLEFRFPLLRPFGASGGMYGPLPVEVAFFADGGVAWNRGQRPSFLGGDREGVASAGAALRINLGGFAIGQLSVARPFPNQSNGWVLQFNLSPGF